MYIYPALFLAVLGPAWGAEILVVHPFPVYSHTVPFRPIFKELARRGHHITILTKFLEDPPLKGFSQIKVDIDIQVLAEKVSASPMDCNGYWYQLRGVQNFCSPIASVMVDKMKHLLPPRDTKFDLIITEPFFCQEFTLGLSAYYGAPMVATLPQPLTPAIAHAIGNPDFPSYLPNFRMPLTPEMGFLGRLSNTVVGIFEFLSTYLYHLPRQDEAMRSLLENTTDIPYISELYKNMALVLTMTHFAINYQRPIMRNVIEVGGLTTDRTSNPLTQDLEKFLNDSPDGAIYFSWGSHFEDEDAEETLEALMDTFSRIKQRVVFKWGNSTIANKPENVLIKTWVPQPAVLAHKNMRLFISHCGLNSVYETVFHGVPVVATPLFGDQHHNSRILQFLGMAVVVEKEQVNDRVTLLAAINKIISDPSFRANVEIRSRMLRDRPMHAVDEAVYWIEYILKHGGKSLQPASIHMPWYRLALLDVYVTLLAIFLFPILGFAKCASFYRRRRLINPVIKKKNL